MVADGDDAKMFLTRADSALYAAKAAGRNCVFCHNGEDTFPGQSQDLTAARDRDHGARSETAAPEAPAKPRCCEADRRSTASRLSCEP